MADCKGGSSEVRGHRWARAVPRQPQGRKGAAAERGPGPAGHGEGPEGRAQGKVEPRGVPDLELKRAGGGEGGSGSGRGGGT